LDFDSTRAKLEASYRKRDASTRLIVTDAPTQRTLAAHALFDASGNLWIGGATGGRTVQWTVYSPRAQLLYTVTLPASFRLSDVRSGRLYGKTVDEDGVPIIRILELTGP
jgi:sugar lactone lactonase YvrE